MNPAPVERRLDAIRDAGFDPALLPTREVFLDMFDDRSGEAGPVPGPSLRLASLLAAAGLPVVRSPEAADCRLDARAFLPSLGAAEEPAAALAAAFYIASGVRCAEEGDCLMRMALPRRPLAPSRLRYVEDRLAWLRENRALVGGLRAVGGRPVGASPKARFEALGDWPERLAARHHEDFGPAP